MNYLAHLYLAEDTPESLIGNILGDFVKGKLGTRYSPEIIKGIKTHRHVDSFTDSHGLFLASKELISPKRRRFGGIIIDVCFDHFLSKNWRNYSDKELSFYIRNIYETLEKYRDILPKRLSSAVPRMISQDWLGTYRTVEGVEITLDRISKRFSRQTSLTGAVEELENNYRELEKNFLSFFPELIKHVEEYRENYTAQPV